MSAITQTWLEEQGIAGDPNTFIDRVKRIVEEMPSSRRPHARLTKAQEAMLRRGGLDPDTRNHGIEDPLTLGRLTFADLVATGYSVSEAAGILDVSDARIRQRLTAERSLYGIKDGNAWSLPRFQFADAGLVRGIERVIPALPEDLHAVSLYRWFTLPSSDLIMHGMEQSPRDWLLGGGSVDKVVQIAAVL